MTAKVFLDPDALGRMAARGLDHDVLIYEGVCTEAPIRFETVPLEAIQERVTTDETFEALDWSAKLLIRHLKDIFQKELWPLQRKTDNRELQVPAQDQGSYGKEEGREEQDWSFEIPTPLSFSGDFYHHLKDSFGRHTRIPDKESVFDALDDPSMRRRRFPERLLKITDTVSVYEIKGVGLATKILRDLRDYLIASEDRKHPGYRAFVAFLEREDHLRPGVETRDGRSSFDLPAPPGMALGEGSFSAELVSDIEQEDTFPQLVKNILLRRIKAITRPARMFELSKRVELNEISLPLKSQKRQEEVRLAFIRSLDAIHPGYEGFAYWVDSVLRAVSAQGGASVGEVTRGDAPLEQVPAVDEDMTKLLVGTYNVCWDCMEGLAEPGHRSSAAVLASRCTRATSQSNERHSVCLTQLAKNIDENFQGVHFMALQESSLWRILRGESAVLQGMDSLSHSSGSSASSDVITLFYSKAFRPLWVGKGSVAWLLRGLGPRPLIVALFEDRTSGKELIVLTLHNIHVRTAADRILVIQKAVLQVPGLVERLRPVPEDTLLICLGDWNDKDGGLNGFSPFGLCEQLPLQKTRVSAGGALPLSCCSSEDPPGLMRFPGDYALSNYPTKNAVVAFPQGPIASDHFPVRATITLPPSGREPSSSRSSSPESGEVREEE